MNWQVLLGRWVRRYRASIEQPLVRRSARPVRSPGALIDRLSPLTEFVLATLRRDKMSLPSMGEIYPLLPISFIDPSWFDERLFNTELQGRLRQLNDEAGLTSLGVTHSKWIIDEQLARKAMEFLFSNVVLDDNDLVYFRFSNASIWYVVALYDFAILLRRRGLASSERQELQSSVGSLLTSVANVLDDPEKARPGDLVAIHLLCRALLNSYRPQLEIERATDLPRGLSHIPSHLVSIARSFVKHSPLTKVFDFDTCLRILPENDWMEWSGACSLACGQDYGQEPYPDWNRPSIKGLQARCQQILVSRCKPSDHVHFRYVGAFLRRVHQAVMPNDRQPWYPQEDWQKRGWTFLLRFYSLFAEHLKDTEALIGAMPAQRAARRELYGDFVLPLADLGHFARKVDASDSSGDVPFIDGVLRVASRRYWSYKTQERLKRVYHVVTGHPIRYLSMEVRSVENA